MSGSVRFGKRGGSFISYINNFDEKDKDSGDGTTAPVGTVPNAASGDNNGGGGKERTPSTIADNTLQTTIESQLENTSMEVNHSQPPVAIHNTSPKISRNNETSEPAGDRNTPIPTPPITMAIDTTDTSNFPKPRLYDKEVILHSVINVLKFNTFGELNTGISGVLYCTNFKLSFIPMQHLAGLADTMESGHHWPLGEFDICLTNIDTVDQVQSGGKKKKIQMTGGLATAVEMIQITCKDFRIFTFSFKFIASEQCIKVLDYISRHAFVSSVDRLFGYEEVLPTSGVKIQKIKSDEFRSPYDSPDEWQTELARCGAQDRFRVTDLNKQFAFSESLPRRFVIPRHLTDSKVEHEAKHYKDHRIVSWSFTKNGCSLLRGSSADSAASNDSRYLALLECTRMELDEYDLELSCPSVREVHQSYARLMAICTPTNVQEFDEIDSHFLSKLEETRWLTLVSTCLKEALKVSKSMSNVPQARRYVLLRERSGTDMCCLVSSLVQIILDPYARTLKGFENLILKEFVGAGHPFAERLSHVRGVSPMNVQYEPGEIFLLFLDCVWQILQQFPSSFEFSETFLCRIWDVSLVSLYDAFVFNHNRERSRAKQYGSTYRKLFDWSKWLNSRDLELLRSPFYLLEKRRQDELLTLEYTVKNLDMWTQCYFRWIPKSEVVNGDPAMLFTYHLRIAKDIQQLQSTLETLKAEETQGVQLRQKKRLPSDEFLASSTRFSRLLKPSADLRPNVITSSFPFAPPGPIDWSTFHAKCCISELSTVLGDIPEEGAVTTSVEISPTS